ncbi:MAG: hypothetical protein ACD_20C00425G0015 [uncultured bacterium]|nr:MAG: hypothetical protein ACD_20C00425G0015 [uncultured bacterium]HBH18535.1 hypothetical protein [Cyanobacteria bacterium UBA9579]
MEKDKNNKNNNILTLNFKSGINNQTIAPAKISNNQSNPIYKNLFKFIHTDLKNNKADKSLLRFNPKDLF